MSNTNELYEAISRALSLFPFINELKKEQLLVVSKILERRDVFAELPTGFIKKRLLFT